MITDVRPDGLVVRFPPFHRRLIALEDVRSVEAREYSAIKEYGGWGIRHSSKNGTAYNVRGNRGVQLILKNGKRVLIGSQEPDRLANVLRNLLRHRS
jgi:hypothetical protein